MKLFLLSSLLALAFGSNDVVVSERDLVVNDRFHMPTVSVSGGPTAFTIEYTHDADLLTSPADIQTAKVFSSCLNEGGASTASSTSLGVNLGTPSFNAATDKSSLSVAVTAANAPAGPTSGSSTFCVWYGVGPSAGGYYGYREVKFTITWTFNGAWTATAFTTQAYDPVTKTAEQTISATPGECATANPVPVKVGEVICTKLCSSNALFKVDTISAFKVSATGKTDYTVKDSTFYDVSTAGACKEVKYLLPIDWFPTLPSETPPTLSVTASGSVTYAAARRMLQEQETPAATGPIIGTQEVTLAPVEESSASSVLAGAAATAAAVGAALLI